MVLNRSLGLSCVCPTLPVFVSGGALVGVVKLLFVQVALVDAVAAHVPYDYAFLSLRAVSNSLAEEGGVA